jgi:hypothetical protein
MSAILAAAAFVIAVFLVLFDVAGTTSAPATTVHHGGAHGRAGILFKQQLSGPMRAPRSRVASTAGITGEQMSGPMSLEKLRLARHDGGRYGIISMNWGGIGSTEGAATRNPYAYHGSAVA